MTFFDDPSFLLSHIRNSFLTSDDTGICELVMVNEDFLSKKLQKSSLHPSWMLDSNDSGLESDDNELSRSCDIASDMDYALRRRSNTAQRLERLKKDRKKQAKVVVHWKDPESYTPATDLDAFAKKTDLKVKKGQKSLLSELLEKIPNLPNNPFSEYAQFDGHSHSGVATKTINIFLSMLPEDERAFPMTIVTVATARIQELIGLICWKYTSTNKEPKLKENVDHYSLHIAEDDGEVDLDFPCLDTKEVISKFGFTMLALVEKELADDSTDSQIVVTVNIPQVGFSKIPVNNMDVTIQEILDNTLKRRKGMIKAKGLEYHLEKQDEPGIPLEPESTLAEMNTLEFCLLRANSKRGPDIAADWQMATKNAMETPLFQLYKVALIHPLHKSEVHLEISREKIELRPAKKKNSAKFWSITRKKSFSHDIDTVAACDVVDVKHTGKTTFRLTYKNRSSYDFKYHDFEGEANVANDIVQQIAHLIEIRSSIARKDYLAVKERKVNRLSGFNIRS